MVKEIFYCFTVHKCIHDAPFYTTSSFCLFPPLFIIFYPVITISPRVQCTGERSNFAVDTRSFLEALKGESLEEALGGDSGYEGESYGGISGASRDPEVSAVTSVPPSSYDSVDDAPDDTDDESRDSRSSYASGSGRNNNNNRRFYEFCNDCYECMLMKINFHQIRILNDLS